MIDFKVKGLLFLYWKQDLISIDTIKILINTMLKFLLIQNLLNGYKQVLPMLLSNGDITDTATIYHFVANRWHFQ